MTTSGLGLDNVATVACVVSPLLTFEEMVHRFDQEIYRYALRLTRSQPDADDLYQETLIKAFRAFDRLDQKANHRAWLYKIATNTFLSERRKASHEEPLDETMASEIAAEARDDAARLDARDTLAEIERYISTLPAKQRVALILRKYHELDYSEIAISLRCSEAAARASVHEALRKLKECFSDRL